MRAEDAYELAMKVSAERRAAKMRPVRDRIHKKAEDGHTETEVAPTTERFDPDVEAELIRLGYLLVRENGYVVAKWNNPKGRAREHKR